MIEMHFSCYNSFDTPLKINGTFGRQIHYETHSIKIHTIQAPMKLCDFKNILL